MDKMTKS
jgi:hypothetical protein